MPRLQISIFFAIIASLITPLFMSTAHAEEKVRLILRARVFVDHDLVTVGDVVSVMGGSRRMLQDLSEFDLEDLADEGIGHTRISAEEVRIRLMLGGFSRSQIQLQGGSAVSVTRDRTKENLEKITNAIRLALEKETQMEKDDILLRTVRVLDQKLLAGDGGDLQFSVPKERALEIGRKKIRVNAYKDDEFVKFFDVQVDSRIYLESPIAARKIAQGEVIVGQSVSFQRKAFDRWPSALLTRDTLLGQRAARNIETGMAITSDTIRSQEQSVADAKPVTIIKARDPVTVLAKLGSVQIALNNAVALNDGAKGDLIRVRNEETRKILTCKVLNSQQVKVVY